MSTSVLARPNTSLIGETMFRLFNAVMFPMGTQKAVSQSLFETPTTAGTVTVITSGGKDAAERKNNVRRLRNFAEYSKHVRTALDVYRDAVGRAEPRVVPFDDSKKMNKAVQKKIEDILFKPNQMKQPYLTIKEMAVEDFLAVGHLAIEIQRKRGGEPIGLFPVDAARVGFLRSWEGKPDQPRYVLMDETGRAKMFVSDDQMMTMVSRPRSYDRLGLSHIEVLDQTIQGLMAGDDFLLDRVMSPTPNGALNLGATATAMQVAQVRSGIESVKKAFIVTGGSSDLQFIPFNATEEQMKVLDTQEWFVRSVAAVFQLPLILFGLHLEANRANTKALLSNKQEGLGALLWRLQEAENANIALKFGPYEEHNCMIFYPVFNYQDAQQQASVTSTMLSGQRWITINEAREQNGQEKLPNAAADEVWFGEGDGMIALSMLDQKLEIEFEQPAKEAPAKGKPQPKEEEAETEEQ